MLVQYSVISLLPLLVLGNVHSFEEFVIQTENLPADPNFMPTIGNGHLGYTVYGDGIFMNGIYNGRAGESRRARIPNWLNFSVSVEASDALHASAPLYELNLRDGYFRSIQKVPSVGLRLELLTYAHRYYNRALVYELLVQRPPKDDTKEPEPLVVKIIQQPGNVSSAFDFKRLDNGNFKVLKGSTRIVEHEEFQKECKTIFIAFSDDFEDEKILKMAAGETEIRYRFIITADQEQEVALKEMHEILEQSIDEVLEKHSAEWQMFWNEFSIEVKGNLELSQTINAGIFYLASSLPSPNTNQQNHAYFGLSPTGLGRGQLDADYEGHNFWDTEIWMMPPVTQLDTNWTRALLQYRLQHLNGARFNANRTGYKGARFPWESAYTGTEVTNPCCPEVATQQVHISADIAFALEQFYAMNEDSEWLCYAWPLIKEIASFLESRVTWHEKTQTFHIENVMGPDEDHLNVSDNVYTNVVFKAALEFASFTQKTCDPKEMTNEKWLRIAENLLILYDSEGDFHPEYFGYQKGEKVKQADVILLGYPLQYSMNSSTRLRDLQIYEHVTRPSGPAMTWSIFAINFLDVNEVKAADFYFEKAYKDYVRPEFKVWSETKSGFEGSANFLTGLGGLLQAILNGYGGIRFKRAGHKSIMEIKTTRLLPSTEEVSIKGIKFAGAKFTLNIKGRGVATLTCLDVGQKRIELRRGHERYTIFKGFTVNLTSETTVRIQTTTVKRNLK